MTAACSYAQRTITLTFPLPAQRCYGCNNPKTALPTRKSKDPTTVTGLFLVHDGFA